NSRPPPKRTSMTPSRLFNTLILVLLATSPVAAQEGRPRLSGPPPLSLDSVPSVLPPADAPAGASAWSGIWSGGFSWKVEGDSNSAEVLLQLNADGTYGLAYSELFLYQSFAGGHWRPTPEGILLDAPLAGKHR